MSRIILSANVGGKDYMPDKLQVVDITIRVTVPNDSQSQGRADALAHINDNLPELLRPDMKMIGISATHVETRQNG